MWRLCVLCFVVQVYCLTEYEIPLLGYGSKDETYQVTVQLQIQNPNTNDVKVAIDINNSTTTRTINTERAVIETINTNETWHPVQNQIKNSTIYVRSSYHFDLQVITTHNGHSEGLQAVKTDDLGSEYYASTFCDLGGYCQMVIASTAEGVTQVYVKLPPEVDEIGFCIKNGTWYSATNTTITLVYPESVQLESTHDLTGTRVYASEPVSVIAGSRASTGSTPAYHLLEQLVSVGDWGTEFFIQPVGINNYGNIVHITSHYRRTYVDMSGYPPIELSGKGATVKRRVGLGSTIYINASQPIQVMLYTGFAYATNETINEPGMTLVPAKEHFRSEYNVVCGTTSTGELFHVQIIKTVQSTVIGLNGSPSITSIPYTDYDFAEFYPTAPQYYYQTRTSSHTFSGILTCKGSAIFPIGVLRKVSEPCTDTVDGMFPGDQVDNDCDGDIDEDYCFENKRFVTSSYFRGTNWTVVPPYVENVEGFKTIKFRLRSCGDVKIELTTGDSSDSTAGKFVISIGKAGIAVYECFPNCSNSLFISTLEHLQNSDCDTLVPYWINQYSDVLCMEIGPFPNYVCSGAQYISIPTGQIIKDMSLNGLFSNATFYYDVYRTDCGKLYSDWRCDDLVTNCWEYDDDLCNNTAYAAWVAKYCSKFCRVCIPDNIGRMFAVILPDNTPFATYTVIAEDLDSAYLSLNYGKTSALVPWNATFPNGSVINTKNAGIVSNKRVHTVYTNSDARLFVTVFSNTISDYFNLPVYPLDALGTEYMTLAFTYDVVCDVISSEGPAELWQSSANGSSYLGTLTSHVTVHFNSSDYVGTVLTSNKPVAVFCYHIENNIYRFWTQLFPTSSWGNRYIIPALNVTSNDTTTLVATARIVTNRANTKISINGDFNTVYILSERGEYKDQVIDSQVSYTITSNFPVSVGVQYTDDIYNTISFLIIPPVDNYMDSAAIFDYISNKADVSVVTSDGTGSSEEVTHVGYLYNTLGVSSYAMYVTRATDIRLELHPVRQSTYLVKDFSYDQICRLTTGLEGDGDDNDCDGLVDEEEVCQTGYGSQKDDYDSDGAFSEDCELFVPVSPSVTPPEIPVCYKAVVEKNDSYCWTTCICPCEWVDLLNEYQNMTQAEKDLSNSLRILEYENNLKIETEQLSATVAGKESAEDSRESSTNIGISGIILLTLIFSSIVFFDLINVYNYFSNKRKTNVELNM